MAKRRGFFYWLRQSLRFRRTMRGGPVGGALKVGKRIARATRDLG